MQRIDLMSESLQTLEDDLHALWLPAAFSESTHAVSSQ
jgi:hypothetical protein